MKEWSLSVILKAVLAAIVAAGTTLFDAWDDAMVILTAFIILDIVSGCLRAIVQKELSSDESFRGMARKALIYVIVAVATLADRFAGTSIARNATIAFYCASEALSILENSVAAGLPVPEFLSHVLKELNGKKYPQSDE